MAASVATPASTKHQFADTKDASGRASQQFRYPNGRGYSYFSSNESNRASSINSSSADFETAPTTPVQRADSLASNSASSSAHTLSGMGASTGTTTGTAITSEPESLLGQNAHDFDKTVRGVPVSGAGKHMVPSAASKELIDILDMRVDSSPHKRGRAVLQAMETRSSSQPPHRLVTSPESIQSAKNVGPPSPPDSIEPHDSTSPTRSDTIETSSVPSPSSTRVIRSSSLEGDRGKGATSVSLPLTPPSARRSHTTASPNHQVGSSLKIPPSSYMPGNSEASVSFAAHHDRTAARRSLNDELQAGPSSKPGHMSADGYLQPPSITVSRPARRNTFSTSAGYHRGTSSLEETRLHLSQARNGGASFGPSAFENEQEGAIDEDILILADQIWRERNSKRIKAQQEAEEALTRPPISRRSTLDDKPLVGNLIGEDHANYVLMYNMLTGIRIAVSRCQAKIRRDLTDADFTAQHKYSFDITGNELTPSAKYDFKFKDYAPWVFRDLREEYFSIDPADYLLSLTSKYILSELGSPGKSGSFFYFSRDYRFIIKTIHDNEHKFLLSILKDYYAHIKANPHTLLSRFYGLHRVKLPHGKKIHFVIMNNLFPPHKDIHETYDLKGSTIGREFPEDKAKSGSVFKDLNWLRRGRTIEIGPEKRAFFTEQVRRDVKLLERLNVMDYSLLVGIHNMKRGNKDNVRSNTLKVFSPEVPNVRRSKISHLKQGSVEAVAMRRAMRGSARDPTKLETVDFADLPVDGGDRQQYIFYGDEGGYRATDESNAPTDVIYYFGIIDICTRYTLLKRIEHIWKGLKADRHKISPVPALEYGERFIKFMTSVLPGGNREDFLEKEPPPLKEKTE